MLIFDGDCSVCTTMAQWAAARLRPGTATVPSQFVSDAELHRLGLCREDVDTALYWVDGDGRTWRGNLGAARALQRIGGAWALLGHLMVLPPGRQIGRVAYPVAARFRHRLPGGTPACAVAPGRVAAA